LQMAESLTVRCFLASIPTASELGHPPPFSAGLPPKLCETMSGRLRWDRRELAGDSPVFCCTLTFDRTSVEAPPSNAASLLARPRMATSMSRCIVRRELATSSWPCIERIGLAALRLRFSRLTTSVPVLQDATNESVAARARAPHSCFAFMSSTMRRSSMDSVKSFGWHVAYANRSRTRMGRPAGDSD